MYDREMTYYIYTYFEFCDTRNGGCDYIIRNCPENQRRRRHGLTIS